MNRTTTVSSLLPAGRTSHADTTVSWRAGIGVTVALWLFVLMLFLPVIITRHDGRWQSVAIDAVTVFVSMLLAMPLLWLFRTTAAFSASQRIATLALGVIAAALLQTAFDLAYTLWIANNLADSWHNIPRDLTRAQGAAFNYIAVFSVNLALFQIIAANRRARAQERRLAALQSTAQQAQIMALQFRINPHFLYNTLNAVSAMIVARRNEEAEQLVDRLSGFLRASSTTDPMTLITLDEELTVAEQYLEIEQIRFGDRLSIDIACSRAAGAVPVPPGLTRPLVVQAIETGVTRARDPLLITIDGSIAANELRIVVRAELPGEDGGFVMDAEMELLVARLHVHHPDATLSIDREPRYAVAVIAIPDIEPQTRKDTA